MQAETLLLTGSKSWPCFIGSIQVLSSIGHQSNCSIHSKFIKEKGLLMHKETICVQSGTYHDAETCGVNTPIFTSSAYEYLDREDVPYPRYFNTPNQGAVIHKLSKLEGAEDGVLFSSGMKSPEIK
jgi:hypothetical protein